MQRTSTRVGRHRAPRQPRLPVSLVVTVGLLLVGLGATVALLPPNVAGRPVSGADAARSETPGSAVSRSPTTTATGPSVAATAPPSGAATAGRTASPEATPTRKPTATGPAAATARPTPNRTANTAPSANATVAEQVLQLVNQARATNGCGAVTLNTRLTSAAQLHSQDQAAHRTMSHTGSDGSTFWERAERAGYQHAISENVAYGYRTPQAVMDGWMNSPGHRANILNCRARAMGLGVAADSAGRRYWTQMFGSVA